MLQSSQFDLTEALEAYVYANSPNFLSRRLRKSSLVRQLASLYEGDVLAATVFAVVEKDADSRTVEEISFAYSCLVALYEKSEGCATAMLAGKSLDTLKWASDMRPIPRKEAVSTTQSIVNIRPVIPIQSSKLAASNSMMQYQIPAVTRGHKLALPTSFFSNTTEFKFK
ncbi:hypothetical protein [Ralstonia solanacearum]|uniref:hypothetical protein n=1 Tax=Ralstonia solanacearum TaxID=305 RepID=UPI001E51B2CA|nr:hypothetical protein [Ralstonia solanacearum]